MLFSKKRLIFMGAILAVLILAGYISFNMRAKAQPAGPKMENVKKTASGKPCEAEDTSNNIKVAHLYTYSTQNAKEKENKPSGGFKETFKDDLFLGDSITKGLSSYDILDSENVCAKIGISVSGVNNELDNSLRSDAKRVFIMCGINDLSGSYNENKFISDYVRLISTVKSRFPQAKIYVQSILPVLPQSGSEDGYVNNPNIDNYNNVLKKTADDENISYLNTASILSESNKNMYEEDGMHFKPAFYTLWLNYIINNAE